MSAIYNKGEIALQEKFGETKMANRVRRAIKNEIVPGAIAFIENQSMVIVSSVDENNNVWTSLLIGDYGLASVVNQNEILFDTKKIQSSTNDVFFKNTAKENSKMGSIFIELGSRRRFRINGNVNHETTNIHLQIEEAYPNCPKYIQRRILTITKNSKKATPEISSGTQLNTSQKTLILKSDTFFVGSQSTDEKLDSSHRGGNPGFIQILENSDLKIPDYIGNSMYNTLGNIFENPNVGLLFIDFKQGNTLQITGTASLLLDQHTDIDNKKTTDTGRYWVFKPQKWIETFEHNNAIWEYEDASPFNPDFSF